MENNIRYDKIVGSKRFSNYFWSVLLFVGGSGFLLAGLSSFFNVNLLPFINTNILVFIPQGLVMMFYGTFSIGLSIYIMITILFDIGGGYNEYNKLNNLVTIVRKGFPGPNREIFLTYSLTDIQSIGIKITEGFNSTQNIYLCLKDKRNIPLTEIREPISLSDLEEQAANLAKFLNLKLENL